ncbi:MAG: hypothetical protein Q7T10_03990 [Rhodoferax sp.]|uniref:hypothetical protein n=1 Tax=Rhodoferax sp. TaxID=50421 RepID=UPI00271998C1|nr:hypothetical protein [Rhodoferax sp.]MDO8447947.1 hypothetical protein [Rhodoferax sp.]
MDLRADAAIGPLGLEAELQRRIPLHEAKLQTYREIEQRDFPPGLPLSREARIRHMILKKAFFTRKAQFSGRGRCWKCYECYSYLRIFGEG